MRSNSATFPWLRLQGWLLLVTLAVVLAGCSSDDTDDPSEVGKTYAKSISKAGGELATPSGKAVLSVLPDTLAKEVTFTLKVLDRSGFADADKLATDVYELGPVGTKFDKIPVVLTLDLGIKPASGGVVVAGYDAATKKWTQLASTAMNGQYALGWLDHFSAYAGWRTTTTPPTPITGVKVSPATLLSQWPTNRGTIFRSHWDADGALLTVEGTASPDGDGFMRTSRISNNKPATIPFKIKGGKFKFTFNAKEYVSGPLIGKQGSAYFMLIVWCKAKCHGADAGPVDAGVPDVVPDVSKPDMPGCPTCTAAIGCKKVNGKMIFAVPQAKGNPNGTQLCAKLGLKCMGAPVLSPPEAACLAFHPGTKVTNNYNGWRQGFYCKNQKGMCDNSTTCHHCPACLPALDCSFSSASQIAEMYVECVCPTAPDAGPPDVGSVDMPKAASKIVITELMINPNKVSDSMGEWFELYNPGPNSIDLKGWTVKDGKSQSFVISTSGGTTVINAGQYLVFGNNNDTKTNGGVTVHYKYPSSFGMFQMATGDAVILDDKSATEVDRVTWSTSKGWVIPTGASLSLKDFSKDNNVPSNWCAETTAWAGSAGDWGSPGAKRVCK